MKIQINLPLDKDILEKFDIFVVGGTIRDILLGDIPRDFDIVVPPPVESFLHELKKKNYRFFVLDEKEQEYRIILSKEEWIDLSQIKGETIESDLIMRDFTINSIGVHLKSGTLIDPTDGIKDLKEKIIRTVSGINLIQDPLRILRAFRFFATLGFNIEKKTEELIRELHPLINIVAMERIKYELFLILKTDQAYKTFKYMEEVGLLYDIFPELRPLRYTSQRYYNEQNLLYHSMMTMKYTEEIIEKETHPQEAGDLKVLIKLAALLHDIAKPETLSYDDEGNTHFYGHDKIGADKVEQIALRLKFSNKEKDILKKLVRYHMYPHLLSAEKEITKKAANRYLRKTDELAFPLLRMALGDAMASPPRPGGMQGYERLEKILKEILEEKKKQKERIITGHDLISLGLEPGPLFRKILEEIEDMRAQGEIKTKEEALTYIKQKYIQPS